MKRLGIMLATILLLSTATQAADADWNSGADPIYSPTPALGWSGFYVGVNGGAGWGTHTRRPAGSPDIHNNSTGLQFGGQVGYNMDLGGFVVGAEADLQWANIGYSENIAGVGNVKSGMDFYGTVRGRTGLSFGPVMPYVTAGFVAGRGTNSVTSSANVTTSQPATHMGWTVGAGLEAQATDNITFRAEYLYIDLGTQPYDGLPLGKMDVTQRFSVVRAGVSYKF